MIFNFRSNKDKNIQKYSHIYRTNLNINFFVSHDFIDFILKSHIITITRMKEDLVMVVTATEFKANFGKYLELIAKEDIIITRNGKTVAKVITP